MKKLLPLDKLALPQIPKECERSQKKALLKLAAQANGHRVCPTLFSGPELDLESVLLAEARATGKVRRSAFYDFLSQADGMDDAQLKSFLVNIGDALSRKRGRSVKQPAETTRLVVEGWCRSTTVAGKKWPPLCCLTAKALTKFLNLCERPVAPNEDSRSLAAVLRRLGLVSVPKGKIKRVEKTHGQFRFA